jgi:GNAT superfamily N-acetyltransferase
VQVTVRPGDSLADLRGASRVTRRAWRAAYDHVLPGDVLDGMDLPDQAALAARRDDVRETPGAHLVAVAEEPPEAAVEGVVGFAYVLWPPADRAAFVPDGDAELHALYVDPSRWGEGVGTRLLRAALDRVPDGPAACWLQTFAANERGRRFYEARGFAARSEYSYEVAGEAYPTTVYARPL